jgi:sensor histidine kinase YesM
MVSWHIPKSHIFKELQWYWVSVVFIVLIIVAILIFTVEIVSNYLTRKLEILLRKMNKNVESLINDHDTMHIYANQDEFGKIENSFYELIRKVKEYYKRITEFELERKVLETQLLQERLNPHFLYNTLSTIRWISDDPRVKEVVTSMVKYYRIALNKGKSIITLTQELEMIEEYLRLQKFAYGTEFEYVIEREEGIGDYLILKHLLQPVVENAVLHGLNGRESDGVIRISAGKQGEEIVFDISDNGTGIKPDKLDHILRGTPEGMYGGYGMQNIRKRLEIFYVKGYGFDIRSEQGKGTTVIIRVPALSDADIPSGVSR